ncbi:hypothetical protein LJR296_007983 [Cupriavidus necator]|uniref:hypothetical protein n=1 Tax=Cupriavidus necator TaxID=106590 RepID=UPI003ED09C0E
MEKVDDFEFNAGIAASCNGNGTSDQAYILWFCKEAILRAEKAQSQILDIVTLRNWGQMDTVRARLESSWALLRALNFTLDDLASAARLKPTVATPFNDAAQRVSRMIHRLKADYTQATAWFNQASD